MWYSSCEFLNVIATNRSPSENYGHFFLRPLLLNHRPSSRSASNATFKPGTWTKTSSRTPSIRGSASSAMGNAAAQESLSHDDAPLPRCNEDNERDGGITSALMVSPTKAIPGMVVTPSTETEDGSCVEPPRPKKRAKRLFSASF